MSTTKQSPLVKEFLDDHRLMTRMLSDLVTLLEGDHPEAARSLANQLDKLAGPHIAFEEQCLYPAVKARRGAVLQSQLQHEHDEARAALTQLLSTNVEELNRPTMRQVLAVALRKGLKHAESCGTLVSHLQELPQEQKQATLSRLLHLRHEGLRWTQLNLLH